ncbi:hypothetical protein BsWGS_07331 [Bradybaena similaris]
MRMAFDKQEYTNGGDLHNTIRLQMASVVAAMLARKVRVSLSDQSSLVLQTLSQLSEKSNLDHAQACEQQHFVSKTSEKTPTSKSVFPKICEQINFTDAQSVSPFTNMGGPSTDKQSHTNSDNSVAAQTQETSDRVASACSMTHTKPDPPASIYSNIIATLDSDWSVDSDISSYFICQHQPHAEDKMADSDGSIFRSATWSSSLASDKMDSVLESQSGKNNVGYGILSRTYQFGAWLTKATGGEKMEVTKKDLNALAPNSF